MRGRKPKPAHMHLVDGTTNVTRHTGQEDPATGDLTCPPADLTPEARVLWMEISQHLPDGLLRSLDEHTFRMFIQHLLLRNRAQDEMNRPDAPLLIKTSKGGVVQNPYIGILNRQTQMCLKLCSELGLSPTARSRILFMGNGNKSDPVEKRYFG